jgi:hypothetical protein
MAARNNLTHLERTRAKIQASMLINRLQDFAKGKPGVEMSPAQVRAAEVLLKKSVPDLSAVDHTGEVDHNVKVTGSLAWQPPT